MEESRRQNELMNSRSKKFEVLRYYNNDENNDKIKLRNDE